MLCQLLSKAACVFCGMIDLMPTLLLTSSPPPPSHLLISLSPLQAPREALAKSVLAEVPGQVVNFFNTMKLPPPPAGPGTTNHHAPNPTLAPTTTTTFQSAPASAPSAAW